MKPIALFYHTYLGGGTIPVNTDNVIRIISEQLGALKVSGLSDAASRFVIGVNGSPEDYMAVASIVPPNSEVVHNLLGVAELPTMKIMQDHARANPDHLCCYLHTKGAIHNGDPVFETWRKCMERVVIGMWKECARMVDLGADTSGAHWLTPQNYPIIGNVPYWGGNFFWASAAYLNTLPNIDINADRYEAEVWIGKTSKKKKIIVRDFAPHFPMQGC